jgi:hypothetical protein
MLLTTELQLLVKKCLCKCISNIVDLSYSTTISPIVTTWNNEFDVVAGTPINNWDTYLLKNIICLNSQLSPLRLRQIMKYCFTILVMRACKQYYLFKSCYVLCWFALNGCVLTNVNLFITTSVPTRLNLTLFWC